MKKTYGKPVISFENFAFSSNIAGACADLFGIHARSDSECSSHGTFAGPEHGCVFIDNGFTIFTAGLSCDMQPQEDDPNNLCYHVNSADNRMFQS